MYIEILTQYYHKNLNSDDLQTLYITTASDKINRGGHLYKFRNDIPGLPSSEGL